MFQLVLAQIEIEKKKKKSFQIVASPEQRSIHILGGIR